MMGNVRYGLEIVECADREECNNLRRLLHGLLIVVRHDCRTVG